MRECPICHGPLISDAGKNAEGEEMLAFSEFHFRVPKGTGEWHTMDVCSACGDKIEKRQKLPNVAK